MKHIYFRYREDYQSLVDKLHAWVQEAQAKIEAGKDGIDFVNIAHDLEDHKVSDKNIYTFKSVVLS